MKLLLSRVLFRVLSIFIVMLLCLSSKARAQSLAKNDKSTLDTVWNDFRSPFTSYAKPIAIGGIVIVGLLKIGEHQVSRPMQKEAISSRPLGSLPHELGVYAGMLAPNVAYAVGMLGYGLLSGDGESIERGDVMARATFYSQTLTLGMKHLFREERPDKTERVSFPSAHTSSAFSFASVIGAEHSWYWGALAYSYATIVGYSRMNDNRHWFHDVVGGMVIGVSYGLSIHERVRGREAKSQDGIKSASLQLWPSENLDGAFLSYTLRF